jgi:hypothetical protein
MTMTRDGDFKQLVRARMGKTGESYTTARAQLRRRGRPIMTRRELDALPDADLLTRCAAPLAHGMRAPNPAVQHRFLRRLTGAQGAVLAFWILFAHTEGGLGGFCTGYPHRMADDDFWALIEGGLRRLDDAGMLSLVERLRAEVRGVLRVWAPAGLEQVVAALERLDGALVTQLDEEYRRLLPGSLGRVSRHIRAHVAEFVAVEA